MLFKNLSSLFKKIKYTFVLIAFLFTGVILLQSCKSMEQEQKTAGEFDRTILPILPHPFAGTVDTNAVDSKSDFPIEVSALKVRPMS
jgi:hypothetical protein